MHEFTVWAPRASRIAVSIKGASYPMSPMRSPDGGDGCGWWSATVEEAGPGSDYGFLIDDRSEALSRSAQRVAAERSAWAFARRGSQCLCVARCDMAGTAAVRSGDL